MKWLSLYSFPLAPVAQLVEHTADNGEVDGSSPFWRIDRGGPRWGSAALFLRQSLRSAMTCKLARSL